MTKLTRRDLLGASGAVIGLSACQPVPAPQDLGPNHLSDATGHPSYQGTVSFQHGVASGDPLHDKVILWTRVTPLDTASDVPVPVTVTVFSDPEMTRPVFRTDVLATAASDYTVKVDAAGLEPGTPYNYRFSVQTSAGPVHSPTGRTRTTAATGARPVRLAVVSCSHWAFGFFHAYRQISQTPDLDAVVHLGDYLYEYGVDGYGGDVGGEIGRNHEPPHEITSLQDYRERHAQYKTDPDLQAAHAAAPWLCTWDDHESANDAYRTGAENHNPEAGEGNWTDRKQHALQAYLEWMPVRNPGRTGAKTGIYRDFQFGDVASVLCLETRLTGRSEEISWSAELGDVSPEGVPLKAMATMVRVNDPERTMLGQHQEAWVADQLTRSVESGRSWQVLANQVIMARVNAPDFTRTLSESQKSAQQLDLIQGLIGFSQLGLPWNLDAWDGFPAARDRLYDSAAKAGARLVTLTGDSHTAWANTLFDNAGQRRGVEFGTTSVTSPGFGTYMTGVNDLGDQFSAANKEVDWHAPNGNGWMLVTLSQSDVRADYFEVSDVRQTDFTSARVKSFSAARTGSGLSSLGPT